MAKTATRAPGKATATPAKPVSGTANPKAAAAAAHQGRPAPQPTPAEPRRAQPAPQPQRPGVPATRPPVGLPASEAAVNQLPAFMRQDAGAGKQAIAGDRDVIELPRLKLIQGISPELQVYDQLQAGDFLHTGAEFIFPKDQPFRAVIIFYDKRYILWNPREAGGGILARADDGVHWSPSSGKFKVKLDRKDGGAEVEWALQPTVQQSGLANWGTLNPADSQSPPAATLMLNYLLAFPDYPDLMPAAFTFQRSSVGQGRKLNTKILTIRAALYGSVWEFSSFDDNNKSGQSFKNANVTGAGLVESEELYNLYKGLHDAYAGTGFDIQDLESMQTEDTADGTGPTTTATGRQY